MLEFSIGVYNESKSNMLVEFESLAGFPYLGITFPGLCHKQYEWRFPFTGSVFNIFRFFCRQRAKGREIDKCLVVIIHRENIGLYISALLFIDNLSQTSIVMPAGI